MKRYQTLAPDAMMIFLRALDDARKVGTGIYDCYEFGRIGDETGANFEPKIEHYPMDCSRCPFGGRSNNKCDGFCDRTVSEWLSWAFEEVESC